MPTTKLRTKYIKQKKYKNCFRTRKIIGGNYNPHSTKKTKFAPVTYIKNKVKSLYTLKPSPHNEFIKTTFGVSKPSAINVIKSRLGVITSRNKLTNYKNLLAMAPAFREQAIEEEIKQDFLDAEHESKIQNLRNINPEVLSENVQVLPENVQRLHNIRPQLPPVNSIPRRLPTVNSIPRRQYQQLSANNELRKIPPKKLYNQTED